MKTSYGMYAMYDADLCAFMPGTFSMFLSDELAIQALSQALVGMAPNERSVWAHRRFYKVGEFDVAEVPAGAKELSAEVTMMMNGLLAKKENFYSSKKEE